MEKSHGARYPDFVNISSYEIKIIDIESAWDIVIGVVSIDYIPNVKVNHIGYQRDTWGIFCDRGQWNGKRVGCYNNKKNIKKGDKVKCVVNYNNNTISYYVNNKSWGIAFHNIKIPVKPAVSLYKNLDCIQLLNVQVFQ